MHYTIDERIQKRYFKTDKATITSAGKKSVNKRLVKLIDGFAGDIAALHLSSVSDISALLMDLNDPNSDAFEAYLDGVEAGIINAIRASMN